MASRGSLAAAIACALALATAPPAAGAAVAGKSVVGGALVTPGSLPSTATVQLANGLCSGSVVSPTTVVTAAHCVVETPISKMKVRASSVSSFAGGELIGVAAAVAHPGFKIDFRSGIVNDIAVLKLASPTTAPPIALPTPLEDAALSAFGAPMTVAGFGRSNPNALARPRLGRLRSAPVLTRSGCSGPGYKGFSTSAMVCASGRSFVQALSGRARRDVQRATCFGDSGGPLLADTPTGPRLLGVTSYGGIYPRRFEFVACGLKGFPDVYTRVSAYLHFIAPYL